MTDLRRLYENFAGRPLPKIKGGVSSIVKVAMWGQRYVDAFLTGLLPALLSPGNLEALAPGCVVDIYGRADDLRRAREAGAYNDIAKTGAQVDVTELGDWLLPNGRHPSVDREVLALTDWASLAKAQGAGAAWFPLNPDFLISDTYLRCAKWHLQGRAAVAAPVLRVRRDPLIALSQGHALPSGALYMLSLRYIYKDSLAWFMTEPPQIGNGNPHAGLFVTEGGFAWRAVQLTPVAVNGAAVPIGLTYDGATIDCGLFAKLAQEQDVDGRPLLCGSLDERIYVPDTMPGDFYLVGTEDEEGPPRFDQLAVTPVEIARSVLRFKPTVQELAYFRWSWGKRILFPALNDYMPVVEGVGIDEVQTCAAIDEILNE